LDTNPTSTNSALIVLVQQQHSDDAVLIPLMISSDFIKQLDASKSTTIFISLILYCILFNSDSLMLLHQYDLFHCLIYILSSFDVRALVVNEQK
jgi:hypothetical protein